MKVTFIHHSCFCVEIEDVVLVFDYFLGDRIPEFSFQGKMPDYPADQKLYVFSSHQHRDHFDIEILRWSEKYCNIKYVFPKDIRLSENFLQRKGIDLSVLEKITYVKANKEIELDGLQIQTLLSTDEGVAFLVTCHGKTIYHAGDLHWWHWEGEDASFNDYQEKTYKRQIDKLQDKYIDVAFVVIDQRLGAAYQYMGIDYFMNHVNAGLVFPMHLWQNYELVEQYKALPSSAEFAEKIATIEKENQEFIL